MWYDIFFKKTKDDSSKIAKNRLKLMIAYEREDREPDFMDELREELIKVIIRYVKVEQDEVNIQMDREGNRSVLGISISAPIEH